MTIGERWNTDNPLKVWAYFDPDADIKIPFGITEWLADLGVGYASHQVLADPPLQCADPGTYTPGQRIRIRMKRAAGTYTAGPWPFIVRLHGDDGTTQDDKTLWLKLKDNLSI
jgi:hypothetical protein